MKAKGRQYRLFAPGLAAVAAGAIDSPGMRVLLPEGEAHHARTVLRLREGATVEVFDGAGHSAVGRLAAAGRREMAVDIDRVNPPAQRRGPAVHLAFAVPKGNRLDWLLEKATELGAASLRPVIFERSVAGGDELGDSKRQRWLGHCISAAKQCGLNFLPEVAQPATISALPASMLNTPASMCLLGDGSPETPGLAAVVAGQQAKEFCLLVGPEGGLSEQEGSDVRQAGFVPVRIGWTTLRVETAAIAMLAAVVAMFDTVQRPESGRA